MSHGEFETLYARERVTELLEESRFQRVTDGVGAQDGWRGEFLQSGPDDDVVLLTHKPQGAPYVSLILLVDIEPPEDLEGLTAIIDTVSDYDVAVWFAPNERPSGRLSARVFISGLNRDDFRFQLSNLLFCREALVREFSPPESA